MLSEQQYIDLYESNEQLLKAGSCGVMNARRQEAFSDFKRIGFPSQKVERYKYTDVQAAFAPDYGVNLKRVDIPVNPYQAFRCNVPNLSTSLYFVVNDLFYTKTLPTAALPSGVIVDSICNVAERNPELVERFYGRLAAIGKDGVTALNTCLAQDGLFIYVPEGVKVNRTIQVINIMRASFDLMANRRVVVALEKDAEATVLFCEHTVDDQQFLTTQVCEAYLGEGSRLNLYTLEETHTKNTLFNNVYVEQLAGSHLETNTITLHNGLTRNRMDIYLSGEGAQTEAYGCVVTDKEQRVDNNALIDHRVGGCQSNVLYKYVLDGQSVGAFAGHVLVREGAQKTDSQETNANLCVSPDARMFTQPMLEIYADDVKCNHGSTVGQLNETALFYMRQRGIPPEEARLLLQHAFLDEVLRHVSLEPLRERLSHLVEMRFRGELNKCQGCTLCK